MAHEQLIASLRNVYRRTMIEADKQVIVDAAQALARASEFIADGPTSPGIERPPEIAFEGDAVLVGVTPGIVFRLQLWSLRHRLRKDQRIRGRAPHPHRAT